jgi:uncharacterized protein YlzI (FlbEa/FlbD family)
VLPMRNPNPYEDGVDVTWIMKGKTMSITNDEAIEALKAALEVIEVLGEELNGPDLVTEEIEDEVNPKIAIIRKAYARATSLTWSP